MRKLVLLVCIIIALYACASVADAEDSPAIWSSQGDVACFSSNGKMGIKALDGSIICEAIYDYIGYFDQHGLAEIRSGKRVGRINTDGEVVVPPIACYYMGYLQYHYETHEETRDEALLFSVMHDNQQLYGFYSLSGELITDAYWEETYSFKNGIAYVRKDNKWNMINMKGEFLLDDWWDELSAGSNSATLISDNKKIQVDAYGSIFAEYQKNMNGKWVLISLAGQPLSAPVDCSYLFMLNDGYYYQRDSQWGMMDKNATILYPPQWDQISATEDENLFQVWNQEKTGLLDRSGNMIFDIVYDRISYVTTGKWLVQREGYIALLDHSGNIIKDLSSTDYHMLYPRKDGNIQYRTASGQWGFMDADGTILSCVDIDQIRPQQFSEYAEGWIEIELIETSEIGYMHLDGRILSSPEWVTTKPFSHGFAAVMLDSTDKWIHMTQDGSPAYAASWDSCNDYIMSMGGPIARVIQRMDDGNVLYGYIDSNGDLINGLNQLSN